MPCTHWPPCFSNIIEETLPKKNKNQTRRGKCKLQSNFGANFLDQFRRLSKSFPSIKPDTTSHLNALGRECLVLIAALFLKAKMQQNLLGQTHRMHWGKSQLQPNLQANLLNQFGKLS